MRVNTISLAAGWDAENSSRTTGRQASGRQQQGNNVYAALLNGPFDPIEQRRAMAKKQAYKIVGDTFSSEHKIDDELVDRANRLDEHFKKYADANRTLKEIDSKKEGLRKEYGVAKDSQEQKDLEILEKYNRRERGNVLVFLTQEEEMRAEELVSQGYDKGYTEYQKRALEWDAGKDIPLLSLDEAKKGIHEESGTIRAMKLERLKHHTMLDSQKEAEDILADASDDIIGMLVDEAKDHVDEKNEEELEKAEEKKEEKKEETEKLEAAKERREEMEALADPEKAEKRERRRTDGNDSVMGDPITESMLRMDDIKNDIKQEVADIVMKMNLVAEDVKGIKIDEVL